MQIQKIFSIVGTLGLVAALSSASFAPNDEKLKPADQKALAKGVSAYWQAKIDRKKISESFVKFSDSVAKVKKKLKGKGEILAMMDDWKQVFWIATRSGLVNSKKVKKSISVWPRHKSSFPAFTYVAPKKHSARGAAYPLILIVADEGEDSAKHLDSKWADAALRAGYILAVVEMKTVPATVGKSKGPDFGDAIPTDGWGGQPGIVAVMGTFGSLTRAEAFAIDFDRVFISGSGKGFEVAATAVEWFPQNFAGLIGRGEIPKDLFSVNMSNVPTMIAGDSEGGKNFAEGIKNMGQAETNVGADTDADIVAWLEQQVRNPYPTKVKFSYPSNNILDSYWIEAAGVDVNADGGAKLEAEVDRATNTITITASQVGSVVLSFNDVLVDMDKKVNVVINGVAKEALLQRNQRLMIESVFGQRDWGSIKTATASYEVTEVKKED
jgi:hypothetical protein